MGNGLLQSEATTLYIPNVKFILRKHMPELDVLRGVAILMVVFFHGLYWSGATSSIHLANVFIKAMVVGWLGVNLFFVLSGFLITGILLDRKGQPSYYRRFYLRRAARILPAYLATIIVLNLFHFIDFRQSIVALCFLANYTGVLGVLAGYGPFWSLSVEEQFYLFWPAIVARVTTRTLTRICLALCILEPVLRWLSASGRLPLGDVRETTHLIVDNLALGALAAIFARSPYSTCPNARRLGVILCGIGLAIFILGYPYGILHRTNIVGDTLQTVPWNLIFVGLLLFFLGLDSPIFASRLLSPLRFFGYISYGLYLIHVFIFQIYDALHLSYTSLVRFFICATISVFIACLSRRYYEEPFLRGVAERSAQSQ